MSGKGQQAPKEEEGVVVTKPKLEVKELIAPKQRVIIGTIDHFVKRLANADVGGKFDEDTYIVSISSIAKENDGTIGFTNETVFISLKQFEGFDVKNLFYLGNSVKVVVEERIEGVTGYKENQEDDFLTPHKSTRLGFVKATEATTDELRFRYSSFGLPYDMIKDSLVDLASLRSKRAVINGAVEKPF